MTPDNFTRNLEILFTEENFKRLAGFGLEFAGKKIYTAIAASRGTAFNIYLSYVIFGRIVKLSAEALRNEQSHANSVRLMEELGTFVNEKLLAESATAELKGIDFSDPKMIDTMKQSFNTIDFDNLFEQLGGDDIGMIRRLGSVIVPENPKQERRLSEYPFD